MSPQKISREQRRLRTQRVLFSIIAVIIIITWVVGLIATQ